MPATSGATGGSFVIPTTGETAANVWYRIHLTVRDAGGLTHSTFSDVVPRRSTITLATSPAGLQLTLDGQPLAAPQSVLGVVGIQRVLGAPSPQTVNGMTYEFVSWSDGGAATHTIATPAADTTYTATFRVSTGTGPSGIGLLGTYFNNIELHGDVVHAPRSHRELRLGHRRADLRHRRRHLQRAVDRAGPRQGVGDAHVLHDQRRRRPALRQRPAGDQQLDRPRADGEQRHDRARPPATRYDMRMEMYENGGGAVAQLRWSAPGLAKEVVPQANLHPYVLLVAGSTTLAAGDAAVRARLEAGGHSVVLRTGPAPPPPTPPARRWCSCPPP